MVATHNSMLCLGTSLVPRLSIILPIMGDPAQMEDSLVSVLENRPADCEILVVVNRPYADPYKLADEVCFIEAPRGSRLVDSINLGIAVSRAPIVHLLCCGLEVTEGWADRALETLTDPRVAAVTPVVLDRSQPERVVSAGVSYHASGLVRRVTAKSISARGTAALSALADPDLPAAFYRKSALDVVGRLSGMVGDRLACVDLALTLEHAGYRCVVEPDCRIYAAPRSGNREGGFRRGWAAERLFWRWAPRNGWLRALPLHMMMVALECGCSLPRPSALTQLMGRLVGSLQFSAHRRHWQSLAQMQDQSRASTTVPPIEAPHFLTPSKHGAKVRAA